ncbi:periplasmic heavy metal sensor [bacterium]|nr:periplasmic heavy metal sensor [bacterium]
MKKRTYILILSLIFNAAFIIGLVFDIGPDRSRWSKRSHQRRTYSDTLEQLPDTVKVQLREIWRRFPERIRPIQTRLDSHRVTLSQILLQEHIDSTAISVQLDSIGTLQTEIEKIAVNQMLREKELLPDEMQERFLRMMMWRFVNNRRPPRHRDTDDRDSTRAEQPRARENAQKK